MGSPFLDKSGQKLYFLDKAGQKLYVLGGGTDFPEPLIPPPYKAPRILQKGSLDFLPSLSCPVLTRGKEKPPIGPLVAGANDVDEHFRTAPLEENIPVLLGLSSVWNVSFLGYPARAILPYTQALSKLAPHIQQVRCALPYVTDHVRIPGFCLCVTGIQGNRFSELYGVPDPVSISRLIVAVWYGDQGVPLGKLYAESWFFSLLCPVWKDELLLPVLPKSPPKWKTQKGSLLITHCCCKCAVASPDAGRVGSEVS